MPTTQIRQRTAAATLVLIVALIALAVFGQDLYIPAFTWLWNYILAPVVDGVGQFFTWLAAVL